MSIDVSELVHDPDFCTRFTVIRMGEPTWEKGRQIQVRAQVTVEGIVEPSSSADIELLDTADRIAGAKTFITDEVPLRVTDTETTSDRCIYRGRVYKLLQAFDYSDNGYYKAIGTVISDEEEGT